MISQTRWGFSIFCEDIREEVNNRTSWMGIFKGVIYVESSFPFFMPKLVVIVNYFEVPEVHKEDLEFRIYSTDDAKVAEVKIKRSSLDAHFAANSLSENDEALISVEVPFIFLPMVVQKPGVLKVRMFDGAQEVKLGSLVFKSGPAPA